MCALFAEQIVLVMFGSKWSEAIPIFRLLVPTVLVFAVINPTGWLLVALGMVGRSLRLALAIAPLVIVGCVIGLRYGAQGVAAGFSVAMVLWMIPHLVWTFHGTNISLRNVVPLIGRPLISSIVAAPGAYGVVALVGSKIPVLATLVLGSAAFMTVYLSVLLFAMRQSAFFLDIVRSLRAQRDNKAFAAP